MEDRGEALRGGTEEWRVRGEVLRSGGSGGGTEEWRIRGVVLRSGGLGGWH